ncbi:MAG: DeoR/GlpR transcriptional regulator [Alphaproteobacteria bacterium]|nr:DeoR/GlpR transcriptional regulator [Alphaproteobacteria bacterium]
MRQSTRQAAILEAVARAGSCSISQLAQDLAVSDETIRRDIKVLADEGRVVKIHGAVALPDILRESAFELRLRENADGKKAIAKAAAREIANGDSVMLDTGSTTAHVAYALRDHRELTVVTNSIDIARALATRNGNRVFMAGGELRADDGAALGPSATAFIEQFRVKTAILSLGALDVEDGPMNFDLSEATFSRVMISRAMRSILVVDGSKFGRRAVIKAMPYTSINLLITDRIPPAPFDRLLADAKVQVMVAEDDE